jgi:hypothetical protein
MKDGTKVFTASLAKKLLAKGYVVVDIKQDKQDPDGKRSIFIFKNEEGLEEEIKKNIKK